MKQGKRKNSSAQSSAAAQVPAAAAAEALPDAAYVDQLLAGAAPPVLTDVVVAGDALSDPQVMGGAVTAVIDLPAQCLLRDAVEYQERFLKCVDIASVVIDVGAVERIDTSFVQVLLAFARSRAAANQADHSLVWRRVNPEFAEAVRLLGLQSALAVPDVSEAA